MKSSKCAQIARQNIPARIRRKIARSSFFACAVCGNIPIIFHHIEEWSKKKSNDDRYLISVCDKCHRRIHGEGGSFFSKSELYEYKRRPKRPSILKDILPLGAKRNYSFFIGSNFISDGNKATLIRFPDGNSLTEIDTSDGVLKLSILAKASHQNTTYLIKDNELMISTKGIWDMKYSGNSLKIWKIINNKKIQFIDMIILSDVIIINRMHTVFNGNLFRIYKARSPQKRQIAEIRNKVMEYENIYNTEATKIDNSPNIYGKWKGMDMDSFIKKTQKNFVKHRLERELIYEFSKNFNWNFWYYLKILSELFEKSSVFKRSSFPGEELPPSAERIQKKVSKIREKYIEQFKSLENVVVEYGGKVLYQNIMI